CRLVPDQDSAGTAKMVEKHFKKIAPKTVKVQVRNLHGGEAAITPINSPGVQAAIEALEKGFGKKPLFQREGGSIPIVVQFKELLGLDTVLLGFGLPDENAHSPNEFMNINHFFNGIKTSVHFFNELPKYWVNRKKQK
ncbi:MAG: M20/M25/M40 family metallo-hydrolase, partial [Bacteroidota bacterium]